MNLQFYYEPGTNKQFRSFKEVEKHLLSKGQKINPNSPNASQENDQDKLQTQPAVDLTNVSGHLKLNFTFGFYLIVAFKFLKFYVICVCIHMHTGCYWKL